MGARPISHSSITPADPFPPPLVFWLSSSRTLKNNIVPKLKRPIDRIFLHSFKDRALHSIFKEDSNSIAYFFCLYFHPIKHKPQVFFHAVLSPPCRLALNLDTKNIIVLCSSYLILHSLWPVLGLLGPIFPVQRLQFNLDLRDTICC